MVAGVYGTILQYQKKEVNVFALMGVKERGKPQKQPLTVVPENRCS